MNKITISLFIFIIIACIVSAFSFIHLKKQMANELTIKISKLETQLNSKIEDSIASINIPTLLTSSEGSKNTVSMPSSLANSKFQFGGKASFGKPFIFALKGDKCPYGSFSYNGPEQAYALKDGFTYCGYYRDTVTLNRKQISSCPPEMTEIKDTIERPDKNIFFCGYRRKNEKTTTTSK